MEYIDSSLVILINTLNKFVDDFTVFEIFMALSSIIFLLIKLYYFTNKELKEEAKNILDNHLTSSSTIKSYQKEIQLVLPYNQPSLYKLYLGQVIVFLDRFFGKTKLLSGIALKKHLFVSYIYSFTFFITAWFLGGSGSIGEIKVIPFDLDSKIKINILISFIITTIIAFFVKRYNYYHIVHRFSNKISAVTYGKILPPVLDSKIRVAQEKDSLFLSFAWTVVAIFIITFSIIQSMFGNDAFLPIDSMMSVMSILLFYSFIGLIAWFIMVFSSFFYGLYKEKLYINLSISIAITFMLGFFLIDILSFIGCGGTAVFILFCFIIPFINAFFDFLSMYFSRIFIQNIYKTSSKLKVLIDVAFDILIAIALFYMLIWTLYHTVEFFNTYLESIYNLQIPIENYRDKFEANMFDINVGWISMMFISTLIPTLLHLFLAILAILGNFITKPHLHKLAEQIQKVEPDGDIREKEKLAKELALFNMAKTIKLYLFAGTLLLICMVFLGLLLFIKKGFYVI